MNEIQRYNKDEEEKGQTKSRQSFASHHEIYASLAFVHKVQKQTLKPSNIFFQKKNSNPEMNPFLCDYTMCSNRPIVGGEAYGHVALVCSGTMSRLAFSPPVLLFFVCILSVSFLYNIFVSTFAHGMWFSIFFAPAQNENEKNP